MWKCRNCGETVEGTLNICGYCGYTKEGKPSQKDAVIDGDELLPNGLLRSQVVDSRPDSAPDQNGVVDALMRRYQEGYLSAQWRISVGRVTRWIGILIGILLVLIGLSLANRGGPLVLFVAILSAILLGGGVWWIGTAAMGHGQLLLATLDTAVNTSRLLSKNDMAKILLG